MQAPASMNIWQPSGTLSGEVGEISRRFGMVRPIGSGVGLPSSVTEVPPLSMTRLKTLLPAAVWFQGPSR